MVLRKRAPPHLYNLGQGNACSEPRSPASQPSPASVSVSSSSPKRLTRPRRAQSSPHPHRIPSLESVYSPDLNTSPAFALMSLEQAQRSPIRTSSSDTPNPWADELVEKPSQTHPEVAASLHKPTSGNSTQDEEILDNRKGDRVPPIVVAGTQRRMAANNEWQANQVPNEPSDWEYLGQPPVQLQSNNPFLKATQSEENTWGDRDPRTSYGSSISPDDASGRLGQDEGYIPMTARLSLFDSPDSESPWADEQSSSNTHNRSTSDQETAGQYKNALDPPTIISHDARTVLQDTELPLESHSATQTGVTTPGTMSTATTGSSHVLIDFDDHLQPDPGTEPNKEVSSVQKPVLDEKDDQSLAPQRGQSQSATVSLQDKPQTRELAEPIHAQNVQISEAEAKRQQDKRSETYAIRHVNWQDSTGTLRESPVLAQNKNGPCPLLALVNALVLRSAGQKSETPIIRALQTREQISLGLLIEALFDELTTCLGPEEEFPDIEALSKFLTMLHTGMNVNPRLTLDSGDAVGTFLETKDIKLYSTFGVPLVHGWIASPTTDTNAALRRMGQYHEDIQLLPFRKQELEDRVFQGTSLTQEEESIMGDIQVIQQFAEVEHPTQLSPFGLEHLTKTLKPGSFSILFRNDHFSTLYKHPQLDQLFTLVTDAGYSSHAEIVWENLVDVNGTNTSFFSGDFRSVSHQAARNPDPSGPRTSIPSSTATHNTTLSTQEQADADYAYALSLQFQEEENNGHNRTINQRTSAPYPSPGGSPGLNSPHSRSSSAINAGSDRYSSAAEQRQSYRQPQSRFTSRREGSDDDDALPTYEQAAQSPMYPTPQGTPGIIETPPRFPNQRNQYGRRPVGAPLSAGIPERPRDRNKDCVVM